MALLNASHLEKSERPARNLPNGDPRSSIRLRGHTMIRWNTYWFDGDTQTSRLLVLRWILFGLVAFDMWTIMLGHSSRYGAGSVNVVQIEALQEIAPVPFPSIVVLFVILSGFAALLAAFGIWIRGNMIIASIGYSTIYFWSQADSYQHHYLVALLMLICCFIPGRIWQPSSGSGHGSEDSPEEGPGSQDALWHWDPAASMCRLALCTSGPLGPS